MKKLFSLILIFCFICVLAPENIHASTLTDEVTEIIYQDDNYIITKTQTVYETFPIARITKSKTASQKYDIMNTSGTVMATYTLTGTFSYSGSSATCTSANCTTSTNGTWHFTSKNAYAQRNQAIGSFSVEHITSGQIISDTLTLTCSPTGAIS